MMMRRRSARARRWSITLESELLQGFSSVTELFRLLNNPRLCSKSSRKHHRAPQLPFPSALPHSRNLNSPLIARQSDTSTPALPLLPHTPLLHLSLALDSILCPRAHLRLHELLQPLLGREIRRAPSTMHREVYLCES